MSSRTVRGLCFGFAAGALASRVLPPLLAQLRGAAGQAVGEDPLGLLVSQHRKLLALLTAMQNATNPSKRIMLLLAFKRLISKHAVAEEDVVYPLLHELAEQAEAADQLYHEHGEMKVHIFMLQQNLRNDAGWSAHVAALRSEIAAHAKQEEEVEFPRVRALREARDGYTLARNVRQEEALIL